MVERYNTGNPRPSNSMKDLSDNAQAYDDFMNSENDTFIDRLENEKDTLAGTQKKMAAAAEASVQDARQNLIPLSRQYMTLAAAQADIANIPAGSATYYRSPDDSALAIEVINNAGTLQPTGRKMPSREAVGEAETKPQFLSRELRSTETFHSSVIRTSNWTNATTSTWAVGSTSDGRVFNFIEMWVDGVSNIDSLKISVYSRSTDGASVFPGAEGDKLLLSKTV
ncbi:TPA: hypothetical protein ACNMRT_005113, partial [Klebsiella pneumoniae]|nr:hypothetical protein [Klebsiella pneumoniae]